MGPCGPVVDVPVVARLVDQLVVLLQLGRRHGVQVLLGKQTQQDAVLQHASLAALVQEPPPFDVKRLARLLLPRGQGNLYEVIARVIRCITSVTTG
uniref:Uncharacterized protein n=1 Tax=Anguilla anguilla TaxID=7936 RepID=A0A0E9QBZ8_ANGAN